MGPTGEGWFATFLRARCVINQACSRHVRRLVIVILMLFNVLLLFSSSRELTLASVTEAPTAGYDLKLVGIFFSENLY